MAKAVTERIRIWGIVQGVGFRPFVAKLAAELGMKGTVANIGGLVEITLTDTEKRIGEFLAALAEQKPVPAEIVHIRREVVPFFAYDTFTILKSGEGEDDVAMIPADLAICPDCLAEMRSAEDRRHLHPLISCMACGPRYTIVDRFPYDRENTSMAEFDMCPACKGEYTALTSRRYHAQTISCLDCGPQIRECLAEEDETERTPLEKAAALLKEGRVVALKGVGGYHFLADPYDCDAVAILRRIKGREQKPFAVMFPDLDEIRLHCHVSEVEERLLTSAARPIVLLERKSEEEMEDSWPSDYEEFLKSRFVGAFLPSMGAQYTLLELFKDPLIVTSANLSGEELMAEEEEIFAFMEHCDDLAGVFYNERKIRVRLDDSVCRVVDGQPQMIRRSKGYVPVPLYIEPCREQILATGAQLKNSFALSKRGFVYMSPFFGDLVAAGSRERFTSEETRMEQLFRIRPAKVACDLHPDYFPTRFAEAYAREHGLPLVRVQHHHAHVASVIAENDLHGPVLGVAFDGTGYGTDGAVWGGEFLLCEGGDMQRLAHLAYVDMIGGDGSMEDGWKSALSYLHAEEAGTLAAGKRNGEEGESIALPLTDLLAYCRDNGTLEHRERELTEKILSTGLNTVRSSSMGRLFDGAAAMLGLCDHNEYEGQAPMLLEDAAARALARPGEDEVDDLALAFHRAIEAMIVAQCEKAREAYAVRQVALAGGVFQNKILTEETLALLRAAGFTPYYNISVSPNDGGIALGQAYVASFRDGENA